MREYDPTHTDNTRGEHIVPMMDQIGAELGAKTGKSIKDTNKNGNTKKRSVRLEF
jgi:hypothetical protein